MMGFVEIAVFLGGASVVSWGTYLWGKAVGWKNHEHWRAHWNVDGTKAEGFDDRVDIVCNACGLVGEFECAACHPVTIEDGLRCAVCETGIAQPFHTYYTIDERGIVCANCGP